MTESQFQSKLLARLRKHPSLKDAVIWKLSDRFTGGIPDVLISLKGVTTFFELKRWPNQPTKIQKFYLQKLAPRSWVIVAGSKGDSIMYSGARGNQFLLRNEDFEDTVQAVVVRCSNES
jgi:hypothetical protein